jgi:hypothetical protein
VVMLTIASHDCGDVIWCKWMERWKGEKELDILSTPTNERVDGGKLRSSQANHTPKARCIYRAVLS